MSAKIIPLTSRQDAAWGAYLEARALAEKTGLIDDGIRAGRAWRKWLDLFITPEQRAAIDGSTVVGFSR